MLDEKEIEKIIKLINLGYTDYKIGKKTGHSPNTVRKCRKIINKMKVNQKLGEIVHFENPLPRLDQIVVEMDNIVSSQKMQSEDQKEWQRRVNGSKEILQEHKEWISDAVDKAVKKRDGEWEYRISEEYVNKGVVEVCNKKINYMLTTIINLRNENKILNDLITEYQQEISCINYYNERDKEALINQIKYYIWLKVDLEEKIGDLSDYIGNYPDDAGRRERQERKMI